MDKIKELILCIQILAGVGGLFRIVWLIFAHMTDDDKTMLKKKVRTVFIVIIIIESILTLATIIKRYYGG